MNEIAIIFGRFNPPHKGHLYAWKLASESPIWYIGSNTNTVGRDDPLPFAVKQKAIESLWPQTVGHFVAENNWLSMAHSVFEKHGGDSVLKIVSDEDWVPKLINQYNGVAGRHGNYKFAKIETIVPPRLSSATALRNAVKSGDRAAFAKAAGVPSDFEVAGVPYFDLVAKYLLPYNTEEPMTEDNLNIQFHDKLNPALFDEDGKMLSNVKHKLLEIADDFKEHLGVALAGLKDITVSGSNAAYNYTPTSDVDLHLIVDIPRADHDVLYRELFDAKKFQYNATHTYKIKGYDVELYVQNANDPHYSLGIYSLMTDDWVHKPVVSQTGYDPETTVLKYEKLKALILRAVRMRDTELATKLRLIIKKYRAAGLREQGEFGPENLAFKGLRANGYIEQLYNLIAGMKDEVLSLESLNEVWLYPDYDKNPANKNNIVTSKSGLMLHKDLDKLEHVANLPTHTIYQQDNGYNLIEFVAQNETTSQVDMWLEGTTKKTSWGETFTIGQLDGREGSTLKAHEFYRAILLSRPIIFTTYSQSLGGMKVWQKLAKFRDIQVFGWDPKTQSAVNIDPQDQDQTHAWTHTPTDGSNQDKAETKRISDMHLVAHRRVKGGIKESAPVDTLLQKYSSWPGGANKWIANKVSKLDRLVDALRQNAYAPEMKIFGEAATDDDEIPDTINIFVDTKNIQLDKAVAKQALLEIAQLTDQFHGLLNAYIVTNGKVFMCNSSTRFVQAPQLASRQMTAAGKTGVPITLFNRRFTSIAYAGMAESVEPVPVVPSFSAILNETAEETVEAFNELQRIIDEIMG